MGILLIVIGIFITSTAIGSINATGSMGGPMAISYSPLIELFFIGIGVLFLHFGAKLSRIPSDKLYLLISVISFLYVISNVWFYPSFEGAYYMLRYGKGSTESITLPSLWEHVTALTTVAIFMYLGLTKTFRNIFSFVPKTKLWATTYRGIIFFIATGLVLILGQMRRIFHSFYLKQLIILSVHEAIPEFT